MIPFASQRALGQDLATHLLNEYDNDYMEVADVRGAVADDLHGAFAEWEAQAHALTKCENYLYSLSINPDERQGRLTRDQYMDYIERAEEKLGLTGQPRAVVFHIKDGREHAHVVWSRIDLEKEKAVQMSFDRDTLMMVTRLFAKEHGLELPKGYEKDRGEKGQQLSLYETHQKRTTGLSKAQHQEQVTDAWRSSDSAKAFVQALADKGYILASGNRPYVLVDLYGGINALPKMINDKTVRTKDIRAFLERDYPPDSLPHVDEAREMVAQHRKAIEVHIKTEQHLDEKNKLKKMQQTRRDKQEAGQAALKQKQHHEWQEMNVQHKGERMSLRAAYLVRAKQIKQKRYQNRPTALAAFLGRVSGVTLVTKKIQHRRDRKRLDAYKEKMKALKERQGAERRELQHQQKLLALDFDRKMRGLKQVEKREIRAFEASMLKEVRIQARGGRTQMPSLGLELTPRGRPSAPHKAKNRFTSDMAKERYAEKFADKTASTKDRPVDLAGDFKQASSGDKTEGQGGDDTGTIKPKSQSRLRRTRLGRSRNPGLDRRR
ncbi:MAG: relaxase/mobilization nuclease domain-containing protein [Candidatus Thiodiazotropha sp.]